MDSIFRFVNWYSNTTPLMMLAANAVAALIATLIAFVGAHLFLSLLFGFLWGMVIGSATVNRGYIRWGFLAASFLSYTGFRILWGVAFGA